MRYKKLILVCSVLVAVMGIWALVHSTQGQPAQQKKTMLVLQPPKVVFHFSDELVAKMKTENPGFELWPIEREAMTEERQMVANVSKTLVAYNKSHLEEKCFVCDEWECKDNGPPTRTVCCQCKKGHMEDC